MAPIIIAASLAVAFAAWWIVRSLYRAARRRRAMAAPFPEEWVAIIEKNLPMYGFLPRELRAQLHGLVNVFLVEKRFEGCGGQEIDDEIRVTVAAQACVLLLNRKARCYPRLYTILVYPDTYVAGGKGILGGRMDEKSVRLGESWNSGAVVLAWDSVMGGARDWKDGHNVTFHEFAHQLDQEDGAADGAPILETRAYRPWARVLGREYAALQKKTRKGRRTVMDRYGATEPAEFFAVATETFFEKPEQLKAKRPELYDELRDYYHLDPAAWDLP